MATTVYRIDNGVPVDFAHVIDAKESVAGGFYSFAKPVDPNSVVEKKPIVKIEKVEVFKPAPIVKEEIVEEVKEIVDSKNKSISNRIIRK